MTDAPRESDSANRPAAAEAAVRPVAPPSPVATLVSRFGASPQPTFRGQERVVVPAEHLLAAWRFLRDDGFDLLVDVTCVDYLEYRGATQRYGLVYLLASTTDNRRLTVRTFVDDPAPSVPSATAVWEGANWLEREVWDMFGIRFEGHPDLRRLLLPEAFSAHPLRKDYPLQGRGERHNFPVVTRDDG